MNEISFECPQCAQPLNAPEDMQGTTIACPACKSPINIPKQSSEQEHSPGKNAHTGQDHSKNTRPCPYCREAILQSAKKCKHCGEFLTGDHEVKTNVKQGALIGAVACFAIGIFLMFVSLFSIIVYAPLFLVAFILGIVAIAQRRIAGGIVMLLVTLIVPPVLFIGLSAVRTQAAIEEVNKNLNSPNTGAGRPSLTLSPDDPIPSRNKWVLNTDTSPIDDSTSYILRCDADEPIGTGFMSSTPTIIIRHKEGNLDTYISYGTYLGSDQIDVTTRIGVLPANQMEWSISTDGKAIFYPANPSSFIGQLLQNDKLVVRLTPYGDSPATSSFDLTGLSEAIDPMRHLIR